MKTWKTIFVCGRIPFRYELILDQWHNHTASNSELLGVYVLIVIIELSLGAIVNKESGNCSHC